MNKSSVASAIGFAVLAVPVTSAGLALAQSWAAPAAPPVTVDVEPAQAEVLAAPCGTAGLDVTITNNTSEAKYVDVWVEPAAPVRTSRDLLSTYVPANGAVMTPIKASAPSAAEPGTYPMLFRVGRSGAETTVPVTVVPRPSGPDANLALGGAASASSTHGNFAVCGAVDGNSDSEAWSTATGWNDGTRDAFPDWYTVEFEEPTQLSRVVLHTLDSSRYPAGQYGLQDWDVQVLDGTTWRTVSTVRDNALGAVTSSFDPVTTTSVRVLASASNDNAYSRIVELEAYAGP